MPASAYIIGIGADGGRGLSESSRRLIAAAEIVFGGRRLLEMFPDLTAEKVRITADLGAVRAKLEAALGRRRVVVLASGDPGFFGIARYLAAEFGPEAFTVLPQVSSLQLAFARLGLPWDDAACVSLHGRPLEELRPALATNSKLAVLTDGANNPAVIAAYLLEMGISERQIYLCQNLGLPEEKVDAVELETLSRMQDFSGLNILILLDDSYRPSHWGLADDEFQHRGRSAGLITKQEIRAVSLSHLRLSTESMVWDIGAGSGAVAIEAARLAYRGRVWAVEKDGAARAVIGGNIRRHCAWNVIVVAAEAPDCLAGLPDPDAVFIGGSGGRLDDIIAAAAARLHPGGRLVVNAVTLENMQRARQSVSAAGLRETTILLNVSRAAAVGRLTRLNPLSPVYIIKGVKSER